MLVSIQLLFKIDNISIGFYGLHHKTTVAFSHAHTYSEYSLSILFYSFSCVIYFFVFDCFSMPTMQHRQISRKTEQKSVKFRYKILLVGYLYYAMNMNACHMHFSHQIARINVCILLSLKNGTKNIK